MKTTLIYTLTDPNTEEIRYVGKSNNPEKRLYDHLRSSNRTNTHKNNWINSLIKENKVPILNIIDEVPIDCWQFWEVYWISKLKNEGNNLTNHDIGGNGMTNHNYNTIEKMKIRHKEHPNYNHCQDPTHIIDRDELYQKYIVENLSHSKLSKYFNASETTIFRNLENYNIQKDPEIWKRQCISNPEKIVLQYDLQGNLIKEWKSARTVQNELKIKPEKCCRGISKTTKGYIWRYKNEWFDLGLDKS